MALGLLRFGFFIGIYLTDVKLTFSKFGSEFDIVLV